MHTPVIARVENTTLILGHCVVVLLAQYRGGGGLLSLRLVWFLVLHVAGVAVAQHRRWFLRLLQDISSICAVGFWQTYHLFLPHCWLILRSPPLIFRRLSFIVIVFQLIFDQSLLLCLSQGYSLLLGLPGNTNKSVKLLPDSEI